MLFENWSMMMVLITMLLIRIWWWWCCSRIEVWWWCWSRCYWSEYDRTKCRRSWYWSKDQSTEDVADLNAEDVVADWKIKVLKMLLIKMLKILLLIERSKCWRCCCWSKGLSAEDVADRKIKVLKMLLIKSSKDVDADQKLLSLKTKDEDYMMLKSFQWFIDVLPWWCWWCPISLSLSYYCFCWCCCRIPFSLRGSVEIL